MRRISLKKQRAALQAFKIWMKDNMHENPAKIVKDLNNKIRHTNIILILSRLL